MAEEIQRALDNLRFDRMVKAFTIISPDNEIFQSTMDSEVEAMVKQTVSLYKGQISQLTVNTEQGLVVISKIANNWLLAVLFPPNLSLGIAVVKTKATLIALRELDLTILKTMPAQPPEPPAPAPEPIPTPTESTEPIPPPDPTAPPIPEPTETEPPAPEAPPPSSEPIATPPPAPSVPQAKTSPSTTEEPATVEPREPPPPTPSKHGIDLSFIPQGAEGLLSALDKGSPAGGALFEKFGPYARDVLFLVDGKRDVKTIAFLLGLPEYAIVDVLEFAITNKILASETAA